MILNILFQTLILLVKTLPMANRALCLKLDRKTLFHFNLVTAFIISAVSLTVFWSGFDTTKDVILTIFACAILLLDCINICLYLIHSKST